MGQLNACMGVQKTGFHIKYILNKAEKMDNYYLNKRRLGTTLLPWQQKICDNQMYVMLNNQYVKFQSHRTSVR